MDKNYIYIDTGIVLESFCDSAGNVISDMKVSGNRISQTIHFAPNTFSPATLRLIAKQIEEYQERCLIEEYMRIINDLHGPTKED